MFFIAQESSPQKKQICDDFKDQICTPWKFNWKMMVGRLLLSFGDGSTFWGNLR